MSKIKVLWIDDQQDKIELEIDTVKQMISEKGFYPVVKTISNIDKTDLSNDEEWTKAIKSREYDLLFIDFNLCNHILGSKIISEIRHENNLYIDIVFYSSDRDKLIKSIAESYEGPIMNFMDDIHIAILDDADFYEKIEKVIDKIIGSWYNLHSLRGITLAKTSKFETMITDIIKLYYINQKDYLKKKLLEKKKNVEDNFNAHWKNLMNKEDAVMYAISHPDFFNWKTRWMLFKELVNKGEINFKEEAFFNKVDEIFELRNKFAHYKAKINQGNIVLKMLEIDECLSERDVIHIRENINYIEKILYDLLTKTT